MAVEAPAAASVISRSAVPERIEYRCVACGYGVVVRNLPDACPMCHAEVWEPSEWRLFSRTPLFLEADRRR
jgi:rubrerythrin